jgi:hypothetical protein
VVVPCCHSSRLQQGWALLLLLLLLLLCHLSVVRRAAP